MLGDIENRVGSFTFDRFWNSNGKNKIKNCCAFMITFFIFFLILILFIYQLVNLFSYRTVFSKTSTTYLLSPPLTPMSTRAANSTSTPFMMGLSILYNGCSATGSVSTDVSYMIKTATANSSSPIELQTCTNSHFSMIPGGLSKIQQFTNNTLRCLPLNQDLILGGSTAVTGSERSVIFHFTCPSACSGSCGTVELFTQNAKPNPDSKDEPMNYFIQRKAFLIQNPTTYENAYLLDEHILSKDDSLLFSKSYVTSTLSGGQFYDDLITSNSSTTTLNLRRSDKTITYDRFFLKMFDVFAYIGGLAQAAFLLFFFMPSFCRYLFEMKFNQIVFKHRESKYASFMDYVKQAIFNSAEGTCLEPDWQVERKKKKMNEAASKLLDTIYLYKRIAFLEEAINVLLEKHQLKGLHLVHSLTEEEADRRHMSHKFRDRVVFYLGKYKKAVDANRDSGSYPQSSENMKEDSEGNKMSENNLMSSNGGVNANDLMDLKKKSTSKGIFHEADANDDDYRNEDERRRDEEHLQEEIDLIGLMGEEELNEAALTEELETDLKRLLDEGAQLTGDMRSKKICEKLEGWLKSGMEIATRQYKREHQRMMMEEQNY